MNSRYVQMVRAEAYRIPESELKKMRRRRLRRNLKKGAKVVKSLKAAGMPLTGGFERNLTDPFWGLRAPIGPGSEELMEEEVEARLRDLAATKEDRERRLAAERAKGESGRWSAGLEEVGDWSGALHRFREEMQNRVLRSQAPKDSHSRGHDLSALRRADAEDGKDLEKDAEELAGLGGGGNTGKEDDGSEMSPEERQALLEAQRKVARKRRREARARDSMMLRSEQVTRAKEAPPPLVQFRLTTTQPQVVYQGETENPLRLAVGRDVLEDLLIRLRPPPSPGSLRPKGIADINPTPLSPTTLEDLRMDTVHEKGVVIKSRAEIDEARDAAEDDMDDEEREIVAAERAVGEWEEGGGEGVGTEIRRQMEEEKRRAEGSRRCFPNLVLVEAERGEGREEGLGNEFMVRVTNHIRSTTSHLQDWMDRIQSQSRKDGGGGKVSSSVSSSSAGAEGSPSTSAFVVESGSEEGLFEDAIAAAAAIPGQAIRKLLEDGACAKELVDGLGKYAWHPCIRVQGCLVTVELTATWFAVSVDVGGVVGKVKAKVGTTPAVRAMLKLLTVDEGQKTVTELHASFEHQAASFAHESIRRRKVAMELNTMGRFPDGMDAREEAWMRRQIALRTTHTLLLTQLTRAIASQLQDRLENRRLPTTHAAVRRSLLPVQRILASSIGSLEQGSFHKHQVPHDDEEDNLFDSIHEGDHVEDEEEKELKRVASSLLPAPIHTPHHLRTVASDADFGPILSRSYSKPRLPSLPTTPPLPSSASLPSLPSPSPSPFSPSPSPSSPPSSPMSMKSSKVGSGDAEVSRITWKKARRKKMLNAMRPDHQPEVLRQSLSLMLESREAAKQRRAARERALRIADMMELTRKSMGVEAALERYRAVVAEGGGVLFGEFEAGDDEEWRKALQSHRKAPRQRRGVGGKWSVW